MLRKVLRKFQPNFWHYVKKIEAQAKKWFSYKKKRVVASGIFISKLFTFVFSVLNFVFLTRSLSTTSLKVFKATVTVFNLPTSKSFTFVFKLFKLIETINLLLFSLPTSAFKAMKSFLAAKSDASTPVAWSYFF